MGAIACTLRVRVRATFYLKLSPAFFHDESSITIGGTRVGWSASTKTEKKLKDRFISISHLLL